MIETTDHNGKGRSYVLLSGGVWMGKHYMTPVTEITPGFIRGKLTAIKPVSEERDTFGTDKEIKTSISHGAKKWLCKCECGNEVVVLERCLKRGLMVSCGCSHKNAPDIIGQQFGRLTVLYQVTDSPDARFRWLCGCVCGNAAVMTLNSLNKEMPSCGCYTKELHSKQATKHGLCYTPLYGTWTTMRNRCNNPLNDAYKDYGGRGISVCDRWNQSYEAFYEDMASTYKPGYELDRIDNNGNYEPDNCRWVTHRDNCQNRRNTIRIESIYGNLSIRDLANKTGIGYYSLRDRHRQGLPDDLLTVKNAKGLRDLVPLFQDEAIWITEEQEELLYRAYAEVNEEARTKVPHG